MKLKYSFLENIEHFESNTILINNNTLNLDDLILPNPFDGLQIDKRSYQNIIINYNYILTNLKNEYKYEDYKNLIISQRNELNYFLTKLLNEKCGNKKLLPIGSSNTSSKEIYFDNKNKIISEITNNDQSEYNDIFTIDREDNKIIIKKKQEEKTIKQIILEEEITEKGWNQNLILEYYDKNYIDFVKGTILLHLGPDDLTIPINNESLDDINSTFNDRIKTVTEILNNKFNEDTNLNLCVIKLFQEYIENRKTKWINFKISLQNNQEESEEYILHEEQDNKKLLLGGGISLIIIIYIIIFIILII